MDKKHTMRSPVAVLLALLTILAVAGPAVGIAAASGATGPTVASAAVGPGADTGVPTSTDAGASLHSTDRRAATVPPNFTRPDPPIVITINLTPSGDADWRVASRFNVSNDTEVAAFRAFSDTVTDGSANQRIGYSADTFERFADIVGESTNRADAMAIQNASWESEVENGTGVLALSFTWENFARTEGAEVVLDDVFTGENATWFRSLSEGQRLVINAPPGYGVASSRFPVNQRTIVLDGPRDLDTGDTPIVYVPVNTKTSTTPPTPDPEQEGISPILLGGGFVALVVVLVAGVYLFSRRESIGETGDRPGPTPSGAADGGETTTEAGEPIGRPGKETGSATASDATTGEAGAVDDDGGATTAAGGETEAPDADESDGEDTLDEIDEELLSDEERVERLLKQNGGRMKQANIVTETGWSNAKVSQLLSAMDEDDRIDKLRIGRENLITLPDEDVGEID